MRTADRMDAGLRLHASHYRWLLARPQCNFASSVYLRQTRTGGLQTGPASSGAHRSINGCCPISRGLHASARLGAHQKLRM